MWCMLMLLVFSFVVVCVRLLVCMKVRKVFSFLRVIFLLISICVFLVGGVGGLCLRWCGRGKKGCYVLVCGGV